MTRTPTFFKQKDPEAVKDYTFDWATWLGAATLNSSGTTVTVENPATGFTISAPTVASQTVTVRATGGDDGDEFDIVCRVLSSTGETDEKTLRLTIRDE